MELFGGMNSMKDSGAVSGEKFNTLTELQAWASELPEWQRLAIVRILRKGELSEEDYGIILSCFLHANDLIKKPIGLTENDFTIDSIPSETIDKKDVMLKELTHVEGVNALVEGECIKFGPKLTVIYGPNASGKSGYSRILRQSCFTRSKEQEILGNVALGDDKPPPRAAITFEVNGSEEDYGWEEGDICQILRDYFAVFDNSCVRAHIDDKNAFCVTPYGFDVFEKLVETCKELKNRVDVEIESRKKGIIQSEPPDVESDVSRALANLSKDTDLEHLSKLAEFGDAETTRIKELIGKIDELKKTDPSKIIEGNKMLIDDLRRLAKPCHNLSVGVSNAQLESLKKERNKLVKLIEKSRAISEAKFKKEPVQPVGTETWVDLIRSALAYSKEAYGDNIYPSEDGDVRCVLCHQLLEATAKERLKRFFKFVIVNVKNEIEKQKKALRDMKKGFEGIQLDFFPSDNACRRALEKRNGNLVETILTFIMRISSRRDAILKAINDGKWAEITELPDSIENLLTEEINSIQELNNQLLKKDILKELKSLEAEYVLLKHRKILKSGFEKVRKTVLNLQWIDAAEIAKKAIRTKPITDKQKQLTEMILARNFKANILGECEKLGFKMPIDLKITGEAGQTKHEIGLANCQAKVKPSEVLCEGEQNALAIADFLTEVAMDENIQGLIFDDPVTSMDYERKELIACRLVQETANKQVIIFTHDILFVHYLATACEEAGIKFAGRTTSRSDLDGYSGNVDVLIFPHTYYEKDADKRAEVFLEKAKSQKGDERDNFLRSGCGALRTAYENFIQKNIFGDVVGRWREEIKPFNKLSTLYFDESTFKWVEDRMGFLSRYIEGHSHSKEFHEGPLTVEILEREIKAFREGRNKYKTKANQHKKAISKNEDIYS